MNIFRKIVQKSPKFAVSLVQQPMRLFPLGVESHWYEFIKGHHPPSSIKVLPSAKYGSEYLVTLLTGGNIIGKVGARYIKHLFEVAKVPVVFEHIDIGSEDSPTDDEYLQSVRRNRYAIHCDLQHDPADKHRSLLLNNDLDLYVCLIHLNTIEGYNCRVPDLNLTLILQNNTGDFNKLEYEPVPGIIETLKICERNYITRYFNFVFQYAIENNMKCVTFGHNAEELPLGDGMYVDVAMKLHKTLYSKHITFEPMLIHELVRNLVINPKRFEVICSTDRYGTFVAAVASGVCGGAGLFSAIERGDAHAVFKPLQTRLSVTDAYSLSPYGIVRACIDMLHHLGESECANTLWDELMTTMLCRGIKTREFGGTDFGEFVICDITNRLKCKFFTADKCENKPNKKNESKEKDEPKEKNELKEKNEPKKK